MFSKTYKIPILLAYAMIIFIFACVFYTFRTEFLGTPFRDSLTPAQLIIKKVSSAQRKKVFTQGLAIAAGLIYWFKPFQNC
jgi:hypothetical protein